MTTSNHARGKCNASSAASIAGQCCETVRAAANFSAGTGTFRLAIRASKLARASSAGLQV
jgi:hypothetical protein